MAKSKKAKAVKKTDVDSLAEEPVTNATLEDHRRQILKRAHKFVKPLGVSRKKFIILTISIVVGVVLLILVGFGLLVYRSKSDNDLVYRVSQIVPYPAAKVNGALISYGDYLFQLKPQKHYAENPAGPTGSQKTVDFSTAEGKQKLQQLQADAFTRAKQVAIIRQLADEKNIKVTKQEVNSEVDKFIQDQGGEKKFKESIKLYFGWGLNDFKKALYPQLLQKKLQPAFSEEERKKADAILVRVKNGEDFAAVAREVSDDPGSKDKGGDLGFASKGTYVKEFEDKAFSLEPGSISEIVQTQYGFHIIKVIEKKDDQVHVAHILIKYSDIDKIINDKLAQAKQSNYVKIETSPAPESNPNPQ